MTAAPLFCVRSVVAIAMAIGTAVGDCGPQLLAWDISGELHNATDVLRVFGNLSTTRDPEGLLPKFQVSQHCPFQQTSGID